MPVPPDDTFTWAASINAPAPAVAAACARAMLRSVGADLVAPLRLAESLDPGLVAPSAAHTLAPHDLGLVYETRLAADVRRARGMHYTPWWLATGLVRLTLGQRVPEAVLDPSVGAGVFLLAAVEALVDRGVSASEALGRMHGIDLDPVAVAVAEAALAVWAARHDVAPAAPLDLVVGDALTDSWPSTPVDLVIGNPPFLSQLGRATRRELAYTDRVAAEVGVRPGPYTDTAALFLARAVTHARPDGRVCLVLPTSVAAARDSAPIRRSVGDRAEIEAVWRDDGSAFDAGVVTFAPVLVVGAAANESVVVIDGDAFDAPSRHLVDPAANWAGYLGSDHDVPSIDRSGERLGSLARVTAGFRDEYYAIAASVTETFDDEPNSPRVLTSGSIEPGRHLWGERPATIAKRRWLRPVASLERIDAESRRVGEWARARLVPKVLVASQTRIVEAVVDPTGQLLPLTPVLSIEPLDPADLARVAAVLLAPAVSRLVVDQMRGTGLSAAAVRISARTLPGIPLPTVDAGAWQRAAELIARAPDCGHLEPTVLLAVATQMQLAYGAADDTFVWWCDQAKLEIA